MFGVSPTINPRRSNRSILKFAHTREADPSVGLLAHRIISIPGISVGLFFHILANATRKESPGLHAVECIFQLSARFGRVAQRRCGLFAEAGRRHAEHRDHGENDRAGGNLDHYVAAQLAERMALSAYRSRRPRAQA